jgi:hypothetical protein
MQKKTPPGLDELMIVNPGFPRQQETFNFGQYFLGEDGTVYEIHGLSDDETLHGLAELYLGDDGTLYRLENSGQVPNNPALGENLIGHYFLGEDGTLYRISRSSKF